MPDTAVINRSQVPELGPLWSDKPGPERVKPGTPDTLEDGKSRDEGLLECGQGETEFPRTAGSTYTTCPYQPEGNTQAPSAGEGSEPDGGSPQTWVRMGFVCPEIKRTQLAKNMTETSFTVCEDCGKSGSCSLFRGWFKTLFPQCREAHPAKWDDSNEGTSE